MHEAHYSVWSTLQHVKHAAAGGMPPRKILIFYMLRDGIEQLNNLFSPWLYIYPTWKIGSTLIEELI